MTFDDPILPSRFWNKVLPVPFAGCWLWIGATTSRGYGSFNVGGVPQVTAPAHKLTYEAAHGEIVQPSSGPRIVVDHRCRNRSCVNPDHLQAVPEPVNVARGTSPSAMHSTKTHCPAGHAYSEDNTIRYRNKRYCRACRKARNKERHDPAREAA